MEDDDEFGDLYTDVLQTFPTQSASNPPPPQLPPPPPAPVRRTIDLNLQLDEVEEDDDYQDGGASKGENLGSKQTLGQQQQVRPPGLELDLNASGSSQVGLENGKGQEREDLDLRKSNLKFADVDAKGGVGNGGGNSDEDGFKFDMEDEAQEGDNGDFGLGSEPVIPGLESGGGGNGSYNEAGGGGGVDDDWDSDDSEDDLQIVLNDTTHHHGPMGMEIVGGEMGEEQEEGVMGIGGDGEGGAGFQHHGMEEQEWGEDGEKKEGGEAAVAGAGRGNPRMVIAPKPGGYGGHLYQPVHSQFKVCAPLSNQFENVILYIGLHSASGIKV